MRFVVVKIAQRHKVVGFVLPAVGVLLDMVDFQEAVIGWREAVRPSAPSPAAGPIVALHDFPADEFGNVPIVRRRLFVALEDIDTDGQ